MKVVLDTNVLLVSIPKNSKYRLIFDKFLEKQFILLISNDIILEYSEIITRKTNSTVASNIMEMLLIAPNVLRQEIYFNWQLIESDKEDNKFVDCAIAGNADYVVTNDRHFNVLESIEFPKVLAISIDEFLKKLND